MAANPSPWLGDKVDLRIQLTEYEKAPRLSEPLSVAEATLMKFGHWFASLDSWPGDLVLACSCEGSSLELIVSPKDGAMVLVCAPTAVGKTRRLVYAFAFARGEVGIYNIEGGRKLAGAVRGTTALW